MILTGLNFGALGALVNYFLSVPFYGAYSLFFGQIFVLLCLLTRGLNAAVIAVAISSLAVSYKFNDPFLIVILMSEMLFVHIALRKGYFLLQGSFAFWLCIGTPLTLAFVAITTRFNSDILVISGLTHAINGLMCASIAALIYSFIPADSQHRKYRVKPPKFARVIFTLCMLTVTIPTLLIALVFTWKATHSKELEISEALNSQANVVASHSSELIMQQRRSIELLAHALETDLSLTNAQDLLNAVVQDQDIFSSMLIADRTGNVQIAAPSKYARMLQSGKQFYLGDRQYFKHVRQSKQTVVSEALLGKGFGTRPIIAVIAPILGDDEFVGAVQGAIQLDEADVLKSMTSSSLENTYYVVLDTQQKVVFSSAIFELPALANFDFTPNNSLIVQSIPSMSFKGQEYIYQSVTTENDWRVYVLTEPSAVTHVITDNFYILGTSILLTLLVFSFIVNSLSRRLTRPLTRIAHYFSDPRAQEMRIEDAQVSEEMLKVTEQLIHSKQIMMDFQHQLEQQVSEKTSQLQHLNDQLYTLSQKDGLTQLLNRSGFDELANASYQNCIRNHIPVSVALIDIDFFKNINDTYGHPEGDKCIVAVADILNDFCKRDTDIIGRYGGEEFILMLVGSQIEEHHELLKMILTSIEKMIIKVDDAAIKLTVSIGVSSLKKNYLASFDGMIKSADEQLYKSKRCGRNRMSVYTQ